MFRQAIVYALQCVAGMLVGFIFTMAAGAGNGWELATSLGGSVVGVWAAGAVLQRWSAAAAPPAAASKRAARLVATLAGAALGALAIVGLGAVGFLGLFLLPALGALVGYYGLYGLAERFGRSQPPSQPPAP